MDDQIFASKLAMALTTAKERLSLGDKYAAVFDNALALCKKAASGDQTANHLQRLDRLISDCVPWDDEFLSELNSLKKELRLTKKQKQSAC